MGRMKDYLIDCATELEQIINEMPLHEQYSILAEFYDCRNEDYIDSSYRAYDDDFTMWDLANYCLIENDELDDADIESFFYEKGLRHDDKIHAKATA